MSDEPDEEHAEAVWKVSEGDTVTIHTTDGTTISGTCADRNRHHDPDPNSTVSQEMWTIEAADGETYQYGRVDGLARTKEAMGTYPYFIPVHRPAEEHRSEVPDEDLFGYIDGLVIHTDRYGNEYDDDADE